MFVDPATQKKRLILSSHRDAVPGKETEMELTIEAVEKVMTETGLEYAAAKKLLEEAGGDPDKAIEAFVPVSDGKDCETAEDVKEKTDDIVKKLKDLVEKGNVDRVQIRKEEQIVLSVPVNIGIIGGIVGLATAPWALIAAAVASFGFGCKIEIVEKDGTTKEVV